MSPSPHGSIQDCDDDWTLLSPELDRSPRAADLVTALGGVQAAREAR